MLILDRERGCMQRLRGDLSLFLPSPSPAGQEADLEHRGQSPQPIHPWCKVNVLRGLVRPQGEVLQQGGKDEEGLGVGQTLIQTEAFSCGCKGECVNEGSPAEQLVAPPRKSKDICMFIYIDLHVSTSDSMLVMVSC